MSTNMDLITNVVPITSLAPAVRAASENGVGADCATTAGGGKRVTFLVGGTYTDGTHDFTFEESEDNASWTAIDEINLRFRDSVSGNYQRLAGGTLVVDSAERAEPRMVEYGGRGRYVRVVQTVSVAGTLESYAIVLLHDLRDTGTSQFSRTALNP